MNDVFIVIHEDRDCEVAFYVFSDEAWALKLASRIVGDCAQEGFEEILTSEMQNDGWIYNAILSVEGDTVHIERKPVLNSDTAAFDKEH
jgi:hypothetical protein